MVENNLTTTARAVTRSAFGVKINDPADTEKVITLKPDNNGTIDLSDLSTSSPISIGDNVAVSKTSINDYQLNTHNGMAELSGIKKDFSNVPNGLTVKHSHAPTNVQRSNKLWGCEITTTNLFDRESPINAKEPGLPDLKDDGISFTKNQLKKMLSDNESYRFWFTTKNLGSYLYLTNTPDTSMFRVEASYFDYYFHVQDDKILLSYSFIASGSSLAEGVASFLLDSVTVY